MRRDLRSDQLPMRPKNEQPPSRSERVGVWLKFGGLTVLAASGMIASVWSTVRYVAGWS